MNDKELHDETVKAIHSGEVRGGLQNIPQDKFKEGLEDTVRLKLISSMDLFGEWGKRSYKNTNDLKHENTSDIIETIAQRLADTICRYLLEELPEKEITRKGCVGDSRDEDYFHECGRNELIDELRAKYGGKE